MLLVEWKLAPQELLSVFEQKNPSCLQRLVTSEFHVEFQWIFMQDVPLYFLCPTSFFFFCLCEHFKGDWQFGGWPSLRSFCRSSSCISLDSYGYVHTVESGYISGLIFYESIAAVEIFWNNESPLSREYTNYGQWIWARSNIRIFSWSKHASI